MKHTFANLLAQIEAGNPSVMVSVISDRGSAPRSAGARMLSFKYTATDRTIAKISITETIIVIFNGFFIFSHPLKNILDKNLRFFIICAFHTVV